MKWTSDITRALAFDTALEAETWIQANCSNYPHARPATLNQSWVVRLFRPGLLGFAA